MPFAVALAQSHCTQYQCLALVEGRLVVVVLGDGVEVGVVLGDALVGVAREKARGMRCAQAQVTTARSSAGVMGKALSQGAK